MFEKIFGIFRKRKKADISQEIPGDTGEDMFDLGDSDMGEDFDADTISLETGMSDGGFQSSSGGGADSGPEFGGGVGVTEPPLDEGLGLDLGIEEEAEDIAGPAGPISPPPELEPGAYAPPKRRRRFKGAIVTVAVVIIGLGVGVFLAQPASIETINALISSEPTPREQLVQLETENVELETQLSTYRGLGTIETILADKNELQKRNEMTAEIEAITKKISDQAAVEERLDRVMARLDQTQRDLLVQKGTLANVQKALKQIEARSEYLISSTEKHLDQIEEASLKSEILKSRLEDERIQRAEAAAFLSRDIQEGLEQTAFEALSSL
jgi:hypothetical protein